MQQRVQTELHLAFLFHQLFLLMVAVVVDLILLEEAHNEQVLRGVQVVEVQETAEDLQEQEINQEHLVLQKALMVVKELEVLEI